AGAAAERAVGRQGGVAIAASEVDGARVAARGVVELVERRHGEAKGRARRSAGWSADTEVGRGNGTDGDAVARAGDGAVGGIGGGKCLIACCLQRGAEGPRAIS